jgi:hypothetical protein
MIEPLTLSFEVAAARDHAFHAWTDHFGRWWPKTHSVSGDPALTVVLEPMLGGRLYERTPSGEEHDWGEITVWDPTTRFGYLWHLRRDRADATDVVISFAELDEHRTRVDIEHTGWERLGAGGQDWRDANIGGWSSMLPFYLEYVTKETTEGERS